MARGGEGIMAAAAPDQPVAQGDAKPGDVIREGLRECDAPVFISGMTANGTMQTVDSEPCGECWQDRALAALDELERERDYFKAVHDQMLPTTRHDAAEAVALLARAEAAEAHLAEAEAHGRTMDMIADNLNRDVGYLQAQLAQAMERNAELREALAHALTLLGHPEDIVTQALWRTLEQVSRCGAHGHDDASTRFLRMTGDKDAS